MAVWIFLKRIFFLILVLRLKKSSSFFITSQGDVAVCVTNQTGALAWIDPDVDNPLEEVPGFVSTTHDFDCDISNNNNDCNPYWTIYPWYIVNSLGGFINEPILDRRWEQFKKIHSNFPTGSNKIDYDITEIAWKPKDRFEIPISIRIHHEAHVFLCDGKEPHKSNCYWLMLEAWEGNTTALRKCSKLIPENNRIYPKVPCKTLIAERNNFPQFLTEKKWNHFVIKKTKTNLSFSSASSPENDKVLDYEDPEPYEDDYLVTREVTTNMQLGPVFKINNYLLCISMFMFMCPNCILKLALRQKNSSEILKEQTYDHKGSRWKEIKITRHVTSNKEEYVLIVSTISDDHGRFWAIDSPRICQEGEYKTVSVVSKSKNLGCQLISSGNEIISFGNNTEVTEYNDCPLNSIGDTCVPCNSIYRGSDCLKIKFCYKNPSQQVKCACSAGYWGPSCTTECSENYYGFGCKRICGSCRNKTGSCNKIDGTCSSGCNDGFNGKRCDIPPGPQFKEPPSVQNAFHTSCSVRIKNFDIQGNGNEQLTNYIIEFKEENDTGNWNKLHDHREIKNNQLITIDSLQPDTNYLIRAILLNTHNQAAYEGPLVKTSSCKTTCEGVLAQDLDVVPTNNSIYITYKRKPTSCKMENCNFEMAGDGPESKPLNATTSIFTPLASFADYTVTVRCSRNQPFTIRRKTLEGRPEQVKNFKVDRESSTSVELTWQEPLVKNGYIRRYTLHYEHLRYKGCDNEVREEQPPMMPLSISSSLTSYTVKDLIPYSQYSFTILAVTTSDGDPFKRTGSTKESSEIDKDEIPKFIKMASEAHSAELQLSQIPCQLFRGPLFLQLNLTCTNEWCNNSNLRIVNYLASVQLDNLLPYSNYVVSIKACRKRGDQCHGGSDEYPFTTKPAAPNDVRDVVVYSKGVDYISLRWKPPYPPTGILKEYLINYYEYHYGTRYPYQNYIGSDSNNCTLWPGYHCAKIRKLIEKHTYNITIYSRNENSANFTGNIVPIEVVTKIEAPNPPYDLNVTWSERNELLLSWKHPSIMNGDIKSFVITITTAAEKPIVKYFDVTEEKYNITYLYKFPETLLTSTNYIIAVKSFNGIDSVSEASKTDSSPPAIPILDKEPEFFEKSNVSISARIRTVQIKPGDELTLFILIPSEELQEAGQSTPDILQGVAELEPNKYSVVYKASGKYNSSIEMKHFRLKPGTSYNVTVVLVNVFRDKSRYALYRKRVSTSGEPVEETGGNYLHALLLLLVLIPVVVFVILKRKQVASRFGALKDTVFGNSTVERMNGKGDDEHIPLADTPRNPTLRVNPEKEVARQKPPVKANSDHDKNGHTKRIKIAEFETYVKEAVNNGELDRQHALFPRGQTKPWTYGELKVNKSKNRYNNLIAYDHSRVVLQKLPGLDHSDYINASYIDGYKVPKAYIATQGPKPATLDDFWRMIWQENVEHIVMLANVYESGKKKVEKYWPDINEQIKFLDIAVQYVSNEVFADFEYRVFNVSRNGEQRKLNQLHFTTWPDHGVPLYPQSLVPFLHNMLKIGLKSHSPVVVHCSAGVGRTGTVLLCDICLRMAAREGSIDVLHNLQKLRDQRANMVDNIEQYKLAHLVVLECLVGMNTTISCSEIEESVERLLRSDGVKLQMRYLKDTDWQDQAMKTVGEVEEPPPVYQCKNRFEEIVPEIQGRVFLTRRPASDETTSYINAVKVDGFRAPDRFIVTQQPLRNTIGDFWRMVEEYSISVILSLNEVDLKNNTSCEFWPNEKNSQINPVDYITVQHANTRVLGCYDIVTVHLYLNKAKEYRSVEIISMKNWPARSILPRSIEEFLTFWEESDALCRRSDQVVVTCYDGVLASGVYVAMSFIIEKMKLEQDCNVCQAVRTVRHNRHQFIQDEAQFEFLYQAAVKFINRFQLYSNFN